MKGCAAIHPGQKPGTCRYCQRAAEATKAEIDAYLASRHAHHRNRTGIRVAPSEARRAAHQRGMPVQGERDHQRTYPIPRAPRSAT
jgi:hypothetical protein